MIRSAVTCAYYITNVQYCWCLFSCALVCLLYRCSIFCGVLMSSWLYCKSQSALFLKNDDEVLLVNYNYLTQYIA